MSDQATAAVVFVHGLARKPPAKELKRIWLWGLARDNPMPSVFEPPNKGVDLEEGVPSWLNYYADVFYGTDHETDTSSYFEADQDLEIAAEGLDGSDTASLPSPASDRERSFLAGFEAAMQSRLDQLPSEPAPAGDTTLELASWLPDKVKQAIIRKAAMEAYYFLFDKEYERADGQRFRVRQELRQRLLNDLNEAAAAANRVVVVAHSMGTMVAYDVLRHCASCPAVATLVTLGSPLGIREVQDELRAPGADGVDFPAARLGRWINIYDPLDPVCGADPRFGNDFRAVAGKGVDDLRESNWGKWRHTITHYLAGTQLRSVLRASLGLG